MFGGSYLNHLWLICACTPEFPSAPETMRAKLDEQVATAEIYDAFQSQPSLPPLFDDDKHPNDAGYRLISRAFFNAITRPRSTAASARQMSREWSIWEQPFTRGGIS